jgi:hypothetical protein
VKSCRQLKLKVKEVKSRFICVENNNYIRNNVKIMKQNEMLIALTLILVFCNTKITCKESLEVIWMVPFQSHRENVFPYNASSSVTAVALSLKHIREKAVLSNHELK